MQNSSIVAIACVAIAAVLGASGQFIFQHGASQVQSPLTFLTNRWVLLGIVTYISVLGLFTYAFKLGGSVRVLYPVYASTFIWAAVLAFLIHGEAIRPVHIGGMILLIGGIVCMSW